jgi:hypothetical protein
VDWGKSRVIKEKFSSTWLVAQHDGYDHLGITHRRSLKQVTPLNWQVTDFMLTGKTSSHIAHNFALHWLLPDWTYALTGSCICLQAPLGEIKLTIEVESSVNNSWSLQLIRAGVLLSGSGDFPEILGWYSPTYGHKIPALSFRLITRALLPVKFYSQWILEETRNTSFQG